MLGAFATEVCWYATKRAVFKRKTLHPALGLLNGRPVKQKQEVFTPFLPSAHLTCLCLVVSSYEEGARGVTPLSTPKGRAAPCQHPTNRRSMFKGKESKALIPRLRRTLWVWDRDRRGKDGDGATGEHVLAGTPNPTHTPCKNKTSLRAPAKLLGICTAKDWLYWPCLSGLGQDEQWAARQCVPMKGDVELWAPDGAMPSLQRGKVEKPQARTPWFIILTTLSAAARQVAGLPALGPPHATRQN